MYKNQKLNTTILIPVGITVAVLLSIVLYMLLKPGSSTDDSAPLDNGAGEATVKKNSEIAQDNNKASLQDGPKSNLPSNDNASESYAEDEAKKSIDVIITDASQYNDEIEVRAFMPSIVESGTCTVVFRNDTEEFRVDEVAYADATTTICTNSIIKRSMFKEKGNYTVQVVYESDRYSGVSEERIVEIK